MGVWLKGEAGRWQGGRIAEGNVYHLEKMVRGHRFRFSLGPLSPTEAMAELGIFLRDPHAYKPKAQQQADAAQAKVEADEAKRAGAVVMTDKLVDLYADAVLKGYGNRGPRGEDYLDDVLRYLKGWGDELLHGRDMRAVTLRELHDTLDKWKTAKQKRIAAIKAFTAWLRFRGYLTSANDPTADLICLQSRKPTPEEKEARLKSPEYLADLYRHLDRQETRDPFLARCMGGLHVSELSRFAEGIGTLTPYPDPKSEIAGRVKVKHKRGTWHIQTVTHQVYEALVRIRKRGYVPLSQVTDDCLTRAYKAMAEERGVELEKVPTLLIADLRLIWETHVENGGRAVYHEDKQGLPRSLVQQTMGHAKGSAMTSERYNATQWPPLLIPPFRLFHPDDPVVKGERHLRAVG